VQDPWIGPVIFYGLQYFSVGFMTIAIYGYVTDCHREKAPEAFAAINLRNIYSFGMVSVNDSEEILRPHYLAWQRPVLVNF
jgi:hypothetical protein